MAATSTPYGHCPKCHEPGATRERRPNGNDTCVNGHKYPSREALSAAPASKMIASGQADALAQAQPPTETHVQGPLAIAVMDHSLAENIRDLIGTHDPRVDQGVRVIPFAASALAYSGPGSKLYRGLVMVPPREGHISREAFDRWVETSIVPYLAPNAPRIIL